MAKRKSKGLGDTVEKITKATGIKAVVDTISEVTGIDCGCEGRKEVLNKLFPYKKAECLTDENVNYLRDMFSKNVNQLSIKQQNKITEIYLQVFNVKIQPSNCGSCWREKANDLKRVFETQTQVNE